MIIHYNFEVTISTLTQSIRISLYDRALAVIPMYFVLFVLFGVIVNRKKYTKQIINKIIKVIATARLVRSYNTKNINLK
jgi:hypothetical protein